MRDEPGPGATTFRYDPADPTPSIGGALQSPTQGQRDNAGLEKRADVVLPRYLRNHGTGEPPGPATTMVATETTVTYDSALILRVV